MLALPFLSRQHPSLQGRTILLRPPVSRDYAEWAALRQASRAFLTPWEPRWTSDELEPRAWRMRLRRYREDIAQGTGVPFLIFQRETGHLAGGITLGNIRQGVAQSGQIGYWMGERYSGRGMMVEAVGLVVEFGFKTLRLHRIEAACIPDNTRSIHVLEKAGFQREGLLRSYLRINGVWQDHYLYALVSGEDAREQEWG